MTIGDADPNNCNNNECYGCTDENYSDNIALRGPSRKAMLKDLVQIGGSVDSDLEVQTLIERQPSAAP